MDDDFCDCPLTCADEAAHSCASCGLQFMALEAGGASCPRARGWKNSIPDLVFICFYCTNFVRKIC